MKLVLRDVRLPLSRFMLEVDAVVEGRVAALFGPSGAGKTSLLDVVAGLRRASQGFIQLDDRVLCDTARAISLPSRERNIGYVPQDLALFPHLSVVKNLCYGRRGLKDGNFERVVETLEMGGLLARLPGQLSGGEKQRVALGRALLASPRLLLLDEPLASLDQPLKARLLPYLVRVRDEFRVPMLYVTHDRHEALALADQMMVIVEGRVVQSGPIVEILHRPASAAVAGALTVETIQPGRVVSRADDLVTVGVGTATLIALDNGLPANVQDVLVCIRADDVILAPASGAAGSPRNQLPAKVRGVRRDGPMMRVELDCGFPLAAWLTRQACEELKLEEGAAVMALVKAPQVHLIPR